MYCEDCKAHDNDDVITDHNPNVAAVETLRKQGVAKEGCAPYVDGITGVRALWRWRALVHVFDIAFLKVRTHKCRPSVVSSREGVVVVV
jgi:hypothetical protein